ncbi:RHS repeat domain-containing protein, partial [Metapseudomonas otitidis]|uniref:RHS repeat domain-containing protein n=1 Tax=Metapseudomonas otitidis TaxID=319939 RepID=UPI00366DA5C7
YNYFRDYDPETGRYVESDPIGLDGGLNTYGYVEGNPLTGFDPFGLSKYDQFYGLPKKFWQWYHRNEKRPGDDDLNKEDAERLHKEWEDQGKPGPDNKGNDWKGIFIPPSIELMCSVDPCNQYCAAWGYTCDDGKWCKNE